MPSYLSYFNSHAHCFTIDHVPENFFDELTGVKKILKISKLKRSPFFQKVIKIITGSIVTSIVEIFSKSFAHKLRRLHGLIKYAIQPTQEILIQNLNSYYNGDYRLVLLTMDMEQMGAGLCQENYITQLEKLKEIKLTFTLSLLL